jgi:hypothetical protein
LKLRAATEGGLRIPALHASPAPLPAPWSIKEIARFATLPAWREVILLAYHRHKDVCAHSLTFSS